MVPARMVSRLISQSLILSLVVGASCKPEEPTTPPTVAPEADPAPASAVAPADDGAGGRIFDKFYKELDVAFEPGKSGGPNGDGTLNNGLGQPYPDDGHGYRLKNLFGWDLRGAEGIYGPDYQNKKYVAQRNLLSDTRSTEALTQWLTEGDETTPAYGDVLSPSEVAAVVGLIDGVRSGALASPDAIFELSKTAPKNYSLREGADAARGAELFADACAGCHGADGRKEAVDGDLSIGGFMRAKAYEGWFKILNGHPGSPMGREISFTAGDDASAQILDVAAAMCDRTAFPAMDGVADVADGDERCGAYLK